VATTPLHDALRARIEAEGPISVAQYMQHCLSHPEHGYYMQATPFGAQGDFITAPEICQIFGELLGAWMAQCWVQLGMPPKLALVELGPGRGVLMRDALRATQQVPGFHAALSIHLVEMSPKLREIQREALSAYRLPCFWHDDIRTLPAQPTIVLANEFFDALPIEQYVRTADGKEHLRRVSLDASGAFHFEPEGEVVREHCPSGEAVMRVLSAHLLAHQGAMMVIDYGYAKPGQGDTLQAVRAHAYADVLADAGLADLTAHVDFSMLARVAKAQGLQPLGPIGQGMLLERLGGEIRLHQLLQRATPEQAQALSSGWQRLISPNAMGTLFKALAIVPQTWDEVAGFQIQPKPVEE
jgi:NADH dehydrogenase [ubiquinone] 1 alpha subcomplex assembly factor 7